MSEESFIVTVVGDRGIALLDYDNHRLLRTLGYRFHHPGRARSNSFETFQEEYISVCWPQIKGLEHYRKLIKNPRSDGPLYWFGHGRSFILDATDKGEMVIRDTAIGSNREFFQFCLERELITMEVVP